MATNYFAVTPILGVNLEGNEPISGITQNGGDGTVTIPRMQFLNPVLISNNRAAIYVQTKAPLNPATTVALETTSTVAGTTGSTGAYISLNLATTGTTDAIWVTSLLNREV